MQSNFRFKISIECGQLSPLESIFYNDLTHSSTSNTIVVRHSIKFPNANAHTNCFSWFWITNIMIKNFYLSMNSHSANSISNPFRCDVLFVVIAAVATNLTSCGINLNGFEHKVNIRKFDWIGANVQHSALWFLLMKTWISLIITMKWLYLLRNEDVANLLNASI